MSLEARSSSALFKRAEQLKRWEQSETNREPAQPRQLDRKIKFSADCVFLAACAAADKEEVVRLLRKGADINTGNVDGLTALHQACIDDNLDMVEFLVEQGADINRGDSEGWTPLHATASCGFISIAKYLIEKGCNLAAVNNDGQLPLDIAESNEMEELLQQCIRAAGIDCEKARKEEERTMLNDARAWRSGLPGKDTVHPWSGATALHVAAAKGYVNVINILLQARVNVNAQDYDGWTPLHGAAHWGQLEACKLLVENFCDMDIKNYAGQTAFDIADADIVNELEELKRKQQKMIKDSHIKKQTGLPKKRISTNNENMVADQENIEANDDETPNKVKKVELEIQSDKDDSSIGTNSEVEKKNRVNRDETALSPPPTAIDDNKVPNQAPNEPPKQQTENNEEGAIPSWRRSGSFRNRNQENETTNPVPSRIEDKEKPLIKTNNTTAKVKEEPEVALRRTHSFETDEKFYEQYLALRARIKASSCPTIHSCHQATPTTHNNTTAARCESLRDTHRKKEVKLNLELTRVPQENNNTLSHTVVSKAPVPSNIISTTTGTNNAGSGNQIRRSFVPPVRDEESETQRKAHAKRVRETRRSTQGVTLDEIKSAEKLVQKKQQQNSEPPPAQPAASVSNTASITATITTATPTTMTANKTSSEDTNLPERRPSWRLRVDNGSKFQLEDANNKSADTPTAYVRRPSSAQTVPRPSSAPVDTIAASTAETTVTLPLRRTLKPTDDKEQDKENDSRNVQATQAAINRRRKPKRRSTGVVQVDMDEIDPEKQEISATSEGDEPKVNHTESGHERSGRSSRLGSVTSLTSEVSTTPVRSKSVTSENGELDYKKLYEESQAENERLREKLKRSDEQLKEMRIQLEKAQSAQNKPTLSETEKRERRAMERKLSEMEEELKAMEQLKCENQKLRNENGALVRVISKLSK